MDLIEGVDELQLVIEEAKAVPLSNNAVINREEVLELLAQLKQQIPDEVRQARWMTRDRDDLLARAYKEAERIIAEARAQRDRLLSQTQIMQDAQREAERITQAARDHAAQLSADADEYIDGRLNAFELWLNKTLAAVERGRAQLEAEKRSAAPEEVVLDERTAVAPFDAAQLGGSSV